MGKQKTPTYFEHAWPINYRPKAGVNYVVWNVKDQTWSTENIHQQSVQYFDKHVVVNPLKALCAIHPQYAQQLSLKRLSAAWYNEWWVFRVPSEFSREVCDNLLCYKSGDIEVCNR